MAESSFLFASSPEVTVSTLWPSRRRAMSSISQMERSSSQTRMLPMKLSSCGNGGLQLAGSGNQRTRGRIRSRWDAFGGSDVAQPQHKIASLAKFGASPDLAFVGLHNLINDR